MENKNITERVHQALEEIRPYLQNDGGDISLVAIEEEGKNS
ncbi:NifU-like protein (fragment) [Capnocytophaga canimorsus]|uniref:NifU-like protein n=1 Tax=Capnocytophaga canimorsus TaxID=28188 RepID=A0A0B7IQQ6_9FLAO